MLAELQRKNSHLHEIICQIEQDNNASRDFIIRNNVLYKIKLLGGITIHKLCLPEDITFEILTRLHVNENLHLSASQTAAMFAMNFYCPQLQKISKTLTFQCVVCTLCKNNYKKKYSGDKRSHENKLSPAEIFVADIC